MTLNPKERNEMNDKNTILNNSHRDSSDGRHRSPMETYSLISSSIRTPWPFLENDIQKFIMSCPTCFTNIQESRVRSVESSNSLSCVKVSLHGPLPSSNPSFLLLIQDEGSSWMNGTSVRDKESLEDISNILFSLFTSIGFPSVFTFGNVNEFWIQSLTKIFSASLKNLSFFDFKFNYFAESFKNLREPVPLPPFLKEYFETPRSFWCNEVKALIMNHVQSHHSRSPFDHFFKRSDLLDETERESSCSIGSSVTRAIKSLCDVTRSERFKRGKYKKIERSLRDEIIEFALLHGSSAARKYFESKSGERISESTIRSFLKGQFGFEDGVKEEIGLYASRFGVDKAFELYVNKYNKLTLGLVKKLQRSVNSRQKENKSLCFSNEKNEFDTHRKMSQFSFDESLREEIGRYAFERGNQNALLYFSHKLQFDMKESTIRKFKRKVMEEIGEDEKGKNRKDKDPGRRTNPENQKCTSQTNDDEEAQVKSSIVAFSTKNKTKKNKIKTSKCHKRGTYGSYDEKTRSEIGKYASTHSNSQTMSYFKNTFDLTLPESTIRGIRSQYENSKLVHERGERLLALRPRGRRTLLEPKINELVEECLSELVESGEKLSSFLVIATAKQVLMTQNKDVLKEFGGPVTLNTSWAKNFMSRFKAKKKN